jgi:hypothetical protein
VLAISEIELAKGVDAEAFGDFFRDEYLPSVDMRQTRAGRVLEVELLERASETDHALAMLVRWSGPLDRMRVHSGDAAVQQRFEELAPTVGDPVVWREVAERAE